MGRRLPRIPRISDQTARALLEFGPPAVLTLILVLALSAMAPPDRDLMYLLGGLTGIVLAALFIYWRLRRR